MHEIGHLKVRPRYTLPISKTHFSGWIDYDRKEGVFDNPLVLEDQVYYLRKRLELIALNVLDATYLRTAKDHSAVNGPEMSFFFIGTSAICSLIDALGGFFLGGGRDKERGISEKRFKEFVRKYMPEWSGGGRKGTDVPKWLWENLRNGLEHAFIIHNGGLEDLDKQRYRDLGGGSLEVHAEKIYPDLKAGMNKYFDDILSGQDAGLVKNFEERFEELFLA